MERKGSIRWWILATISFGCAMLYFSAMCLASRPTEAMELFGMNQAQLTAISTIGNLPGAFFSVWLGHMFDKKGVKVFPGVLLILATICQIARVFCTSYMLLVVLTFLAGVFWLPTQILQGKLLGGWFSRKEMGLAMGIYGASAGIGTTCAFAFGSVIPTIKMAFIIIAILYVIVTVMWFAFVSMPAGFDQPAEAAGDAPKANMSELFKSKTMWLVMICGGLAVGASMLLNSYIINALLGKGMAASTASVLSTVMNVMLILGGLASGVVVSKLGKYNGSYIVICAGGAVCYYAAYMLPLSGLTPVLLVLGAFIVAGSIGVNMTRIPLLPLTGEVSVENVGAAGGMNNTAVGVCSFVLPTLVSAFVGDNYTVIFTIIAITLIIVAVVGGFIMPELGEKGKLAQASANK